MLPHLQALAVRNEVAAETLRQIERDRRRASGQVRRALEHIEANLFDPNLSVKTMMVACGIGDNSITTAFNRLMRVTPWKYIQGHRMVVARRLLYDTDVSISQISELVGSSSLSAFSRSFKRFHEGQSPQAYRAAREENADKHVSSTAAEHEAQALCQALLHLPQADRLNRPWKKSATA